MGALISSLFSWLFGGQSKYPALGPNPDTADPGTGLTPRQARAVLQTWDMVRPNIKEHGVRFFIKLFKAYPQTQAKFKQFANMDPDSLIDNKRMAAHANIVMLSISGIVDNLGDPETLQEILKTTGTNHKRRGIDKEYFTYVKVVLMEYMEENLGGEWTPTARHGWDIALSAVVAVVGAAYDKRDE